MERETLAALFLMGLGVVFFLHNEKMAEGAAKFYAKIYTEKNMKIIFRIVGVILIIGGMLIVLTK